MRNTGLEETQAGIKIARRNINDLRYADDTTLLAESEEELKSVLMKVKEESEKAGLKLDVQKTKIMASSPEVKVAQWCPTLCNPIDYTVHGILQSRILKWAAFPFSRGSSQPRDRTQISLIVDR